MVSAWSSTLGLVLGVKESKLEKDLGEKRATERLLDNLFLKGDYIIGLDAIRSHWAVENSLHWTMDVTFREDESRVRVKHAAANLAVIRRMALNMLKKESSMERSMRRKRKLCGWDTNYLEKVIWGNHHV